MLCYSCCVGRKKHSQPNAINSVNNLHNGGVKIQCRNQTEVVKLQENAILELGEDYTITIPRRRYPKIRVTNMSNKLSDVDIVKSIKEQSELKRDAVMKVVHTFEVAYNETYGAIIELDSNSFNVLMRNENVRIGADICYVTESLSVLRCYNCCGYNHNSNTCKNKRACFAVVNTLLRNVRQRKTNASIAKLLLKNEN